MGSFDINKKRMFHILIIFVFGLIGLMTRLSWIQVIDTRDFSSNHVDLIEKSVAQRQQEFILSTGRGNIFDRNRVSLLGQRNIKTVIIFPFSKDSFKKSDINKISSILDMSLEQLSNQIEALKEPTYVTLNNKPIEITEKQEQEIKALNIPGVLASDYTYQDESKMLAKHAIGYLSYITRDEISKYEDYIEQGFLNRASQIGRSGLQQSFQEILMGAGESRIAYFVDNRQRPLNGLSSKYQFPNDFFYPLSLVTTMDYKVQEIAENQLRLNGVNDGSVVILDAHNANILAMANGPDFNINNVNPSSTDWNNKGAQIIEPGSIFKTVIAIAAIEEGVVAQDERFYCNQDYGAYKFSCWEKHGEESFEEAYANSCNIVFGELATRLGDDKIEEYAKKLGVLGKISWEGDFFDASNGNFKQLAEEEPSRVFVEGTARNDMGSILRTGIGQQDVKISPLAAANMIVTILNDGKVFEPRLVEKVIYKDGTDYYYFKEHSQGNTISSASYKKMREMMEQVVDEGTGQRLKNAKWKLAGKSGTAETNGSKKLNNLWFIGYGPVEDPRYAVAVAIKNEPSSAIAQRVFQGVMDDLARFEEGSY